MSYSPWLEHPLTKLFSQTVLDGQAASPKAEQPQAPVGSLAWDQIGPLHVVTPHL